MRAPAGRSRDRKDRRIQVGVDAEHLIDDAGIEVHVRRDDRIGAATLFVELDCQFLNVGNKVEFALVAFIFANSRAFSLGGRHEDPTRYRRHGPFRRQDPCG